MINKYLIIQLTKTYKHEKLLKQYGFNSDMQYFEMIRESLLNGQRTQAKEQFNAMPKADRKIMVNSLVLGNWGDASADEKTFFINII